MIIQNLSLRVPGRAALVDGTNWLVPRALLASKIKPCVTAAELFTEPSKLALSLAKQPRQLSGGVRSFFGHKSSFARKSCETAQQELASVLRPLATNSQLHKRFASAATAAADGFARRSDARTFLSSRAGGPALRGELVDILFRRRWQHVAGKIIWRPSPMCGSRRSAWPFSVRLCALGIRIDRHARVERRPHGPEAVPLRRRAVRVRWSVEPAFVETPEAAELRSRRPHL